MFYARTLNTAAAKSLRYSIAMPVSALGRLQAEKRQKKKREEKNVSAKERMKEEETDCQKAERDADGVKIKRQTD